MNLEGKGAVVTGASRGLGAAVARQLAAHGAKVVLVARGEAALEEVAAGIRATGGTAHALADDVGDKRAIHRISALAAEAVGRVELLVHNASELGPTPLKPLLDTDCEDLERVLAVNLLGPFRLTKAVMGPALLAGTGMVVQVTSDASVQPYPGWGAYGVSKAALDHLGRIWAEETRALGLTFLTVDPGEMDTRMHADAMPDADRASLAQPDAVGRRLVELIRAQAPPPSGTRLELAGWVGGAR